jgi:hypothetical protein
VQTIAHPAISVWSVAVDPNTGDIASGASDKYVRVFSRNEKSWAPQEVLNVSIVGLHIARLTEYRNLSKASQLLRSQRKDSISVMKNGAG